MGTPARNNSRIFDQFLLMEQLGTINSAMAIGIFRNLLNWGGTAKEGDLAARVGSRLFRPEWKPLIEKLHEMGYVTFQGTGHGMSRTVSLTENAREFLAEKEIKAEPEPTPEPVTDPQPTE